MNQARQNVIDALIDIAAGLPRATRLTLRPQFEQVLEGLGLDVREHLYLFGGRPRDAAAGPHKYDRLHYVVTAELDQQRYVATLRECAQLCGVKADSFAVLWANAPRDRETKNKLLTRTTRLGVVYITKTFKPLLEVPQGYKPLAPMLAPASVVKLPDGRQIRPLVRSY